MRTGQPRRWAIHPYTDKELRVVAMRVGGLKPAEIARRLSLSPTAVYNRLSRVYQKAGLSGAAELVPWAHAVAFDVELPKEPEAKRVPKKRGRKRIYMRRIGI